MQTLTVGSFLNLENLECVEALKLTARRLAEHTATVIAEKLTAAALADLANNLWNKAEYVARETERRRLHEIFVENFCERFRELKPEVLSAATSENDVPSTVSKIGNDSLAEQSPAPEIIGCDKSVSPTAESAYFNAPSEADQTVTEGKRDEFLGFVKTDEPFAATSIAKTEAVQATDGFVSETSKSENESGAAEEATNSENDQVAAVVEVLAENRKIEKSPRAAATVATENNSQAVSANKNGTNKTEMKEPFEFEKCTINLNLVLLPSPAGEHGRKLIVSAVSHNLPPEIEFLEISDGEDLTEIASLVRDKLARFKQTLPAKYIEQLRASKTKTANKPAVAKTSTNVAAMTKPEINQTNIEKMSGSHSAQDVSGTETDRSRAEITATKDNVSAQPELLAIVPPQQVPTINVQPSLF